MKKHLSPVPGVRLALEPRIVFDAAMAALAPNVAGFASLLDLSGPQTMEVVEDAQLSFTGANAISVDYGQGHNFDAQNLFSIAVSNGQFSNTQGSLGNSVELTGVTQAAVADFLSDLKYTPDADFNGTATLTVNAQVASGGAFYSKVVEIVVAADADIVDDTLTTVKNVPVTGDLLGGFAGGSADNFEGSPSITAVSQGAHGSVTIEQNGRVTYNPDPGYAGPDSFTYTVTSGGVTETGHVSVTVYAEPIDGPSGISTNEDVGFAFTGANAISVDYGQGHNFEAGNLFSIAVSHGEFANTEGSLGNSVALTGVSQAAVADFLSDLKYTPDADFNGTATLTINAEVASGGAHYTKVMDILVAPVADIVADKLTTFKGTTVTANLLTGTHKASADNFEGAPVITSVSQGSHGKVTIGANGEVSYKPTGEYTGPDSFTYTVTSGGVTETASVSVTVKQGNVPTQIGGAISGTGTEDAAQPVTGTLVVTDANGL
ncbi:Ig-like domain-containing protein, partial [Caenimonas sp. SL110]|uniref:Ig-like domain-containing protein n=1 Tax=Caenimonas sp. SL110 TaxID=1450524 RepID=UPI0018724610